MNISLVRMVLIVIIAGRLHAETSAFSSQKSNDNDGATMGHLHDTGYYINTSYQCGSYPRINIGTRDGLCVGLVNYQSDNPLRFPRNIIQIPQIKNSFIIADMGGWYDGGGKIYKMTLRENNYPIFEELFAGLNLPHGLGIGPDNNIYVGLTDSIVRLSNLGGDPKIETVIADLPGLYFTRPGTEKNGKYRHPLSQILFDQKGNLLVNVGSFTDNCENNSEVHFCDEELFHGASIWKFILKRDSTATSHNQYKETKLEWDQQPVILATGLRNSMGIVQHHSGNILQAENARDLSARGNPFEEINLIRESTHYGWPYCYNIGDTSPKFIDFQPFCSGEVTHYHPHLGTLEYAEPLMLLPPHAAPLDLKYYPGGDLLSDISRVPESLLIVPMHGYRRTGHRIAAYHTDSNGIPVLGPQDIAGTIVQPYYLIDGEETGGDYGQDHVKAAVPIYLISDWEKRSGRYPRPAGAPVSVYFSDSDSMWVVDDKNRSILLMQHSSDALNEKKLGPGIDFSNTYYLGRIINEMQHNRALAYASNLVMELVGQKCAGCHMPHEESQSMLEYMLASPNWVTPGFAEDSAMYKRIVGNDAGTRMPPSGKYLADDEAELIRAWIDKMFASYPVAQNNNSFTVRIRSNPSLKESIVCGASNSGEKFVVLDQLIDSEGNSWLEILPNQELLTGSIALGCSSFWTVAQYYEFLNN